MEVNKYQRIFLESQNWGTDIETTDTCRKYHNYIEKPYGSWKDPRKRTKKCRHFHYFNTTHQKFFFWRSPRLSMTNLPTEKNFALTSSIKYAQAILLVTPDTHNTYQSIPRSNKPSKRQTCQRNSILQKNPRLQSNSSRISCIRDCITASSTAPALIVRVHHCVTLRNEQKRYIN